METIQTLLGFTQITVSSLFMFWVWNNAEIMQLGKDKMLKDYLSVGYIKIAFSYAMILSIINSAYYIVKVN